MKTSKVIGDDLSSNAQNTLNSLHKGGQKL
jgi:hypothetical protein